MRGRGDPKAAACAAKRRRAQWMRIAVFRDDPAPQALALRAAGPIRPKGTSPRSGESQIQKTFRERDRKLAILHEITTELVRMLGPNIAVDDLAVRNMTRCGGKGSGAEPADSPPELGEASRHPRLQVREGGPAARSGRSRAHIEDMLALRCKTE